MKSLLVINASARTTRSVTRHLTTRFATAWRARQPESEVIDRDLGAHPVPSISADWIASAFADPAKHTPAMREAVALSETLIDEIFRASAIVIGVPMYNFGMPGQLKSYLDQIVRAGRTFTFSEQAGAEPYRALVPSKPVVVFTSCGANGYEPGGPVAHLNFLEPHLAAVLGFIGLTDLSFIRVCSEEAKDERFRETLAVAELGIENIVNRPGGELSETDPRELAASLEGV